MYPVLYWLLKKGKKEVQPLIICIDIRCAVTATTCEPLIHYKMKGFIIMKEKISWIIPRFSTLLCTLIRISIINSDITNINRCKLSFICRTKDWKVHIYYRLKTLCWNITSSMINDSTYFQTLLYDKILYDIFCNVSQYMKVFSK